MGGCGARYGREVFHSSRDKLTDDTPVYAAAVLLHPAYRKAYFDTHWAHQRQYIEPTIHAARRLWQKHFKPRIEGTTQTPQSSEIGHTENPFQRFKANAAGAIYDQLRDEFDDFLGATPHIIGEQSALSWWLESARQFVYPNLARGLPRSSRSHQCQPSRNGFSQILINNAGAMMPRHHFGPVDSFTPEELSANISINASFPLLLTGALMPLLVANQPSLTLNVGSLADVGMPLFPSYGPSKAFLMNSSIELGLESVLEGRDVEVLGLRIFQVTETSTTALPPSLLIPDAATWVKTALARVGCGRPTILPYWSHAVQLALLEALPDWAKRKALISAVRKMRGDSTGKTDAAAAVTDLQKKALGLPTDDARSVSSIASMEGQERASIWASINNAWIKLNEYYTLLGRSPLFAASVVLNPDLGPRWLETNWTFPEQLQRLRDAKDGIKGYFERWYSNDDDASEESVFATPSLTPRPEQTLWSEALGLDDSPSHHLRYRALSRRTAKMPSSPGSLESRTGFLMLHPPSTIQSLPHFAIQQLCTVHSEVLADHAGLNPLGVHGDSVGQTRKYAAERWRCCWRWYPVPPIKPVARGVAIDPEG
ncbi:hypothetical protein MRS44_017883 [Fusarium solani]|uniref:uncharacterized protein n=1 Tax=Fusarium solani TaxID=169388 RepID=UPI0032C469A9|nr:hypothetical protein MRS44_017883 [Fusarium solani]